jgi:hypothetical protein
MGTPVAAMSVMILRQAPHGDRVGPATRNRGPSFDVGFEG